MPALGRIFSDNSLLFNDLSIKTGIENLDNVFMSAFSKNIYFCKETIEALSTIGCALSCPQNLDRNLLFGFQINSKFYPIK